MVEYSLNKYYSDRVKIGLELIDENGGIIGSFASMADCAKYLNVTSMTVSKRLQSGKPFLFYNKLVSLLPYEVWMHKKKLM